MPFDITAIHNKAEAIALRPAEHQAGHVQRPQKAPAADEPGITVEARSDFAAVTPPIDAERVDQIRKALEDGSYPIIPTKIADAMIAARLMLSTR